MSDEEDFMNTGRIPLALKEILDDGEILFFPSSIPHSFLDKP